MNITYIIAKYEKNAANCDAFCIYGKFKHKSTSCVVYTLCRTRKHNFSVKVER